MMLKYVALTVLGAISALCLLAALGILDSWSDASTFRRNCNAAGGIPLRDMNGVLRCADELLPPPSKEPSTWNDNTRS